MFEKEVMRNLLKINKDKKN